MHLYGVQIFRISALAVELIHPINHHTLQTCDRDGRWSTEKDIIIGTNAEEAAFLQTAFDSRNVPCPLPLFEVSVHQGLMLKESST